MTSLYEPAYRRLARLIREDIKAGKLQPGQLLPSQQRLADIHGVGVDTARDALAVLRSSGEIVTVRGVGSTVAEPYDAEDEPVGEGDRISARMPTDDEMRDMDIRPGVPLLTVERDGVEVMALPADRRALVVRKGPRARQG